MKRRTAEQDAEDDPDQQEEVQACRPRRTASGKAVPANPTIRATSTKRRRADMRNIGAAEREDQDASGSAVQESKPMIDGVRIRLSDTVWNRTVETPME